MILKTKHAKSCHNLYPFSVFPMCDGECGKKGYRNQYRARHPRLATTQRPHQKMDGMIWRKHLLKLERNSYIEQEFNQMKARSL